MILALSTDSERDTITRPSRSRSVRRRRDSTVLPEPMIAVTAIRRPPMMAARMSRGDLGMVLGLEEAGVGGRPCQAVKSASPR